MAPKRTTRSTTVPETTNTTSVTNAQLQAMINQGVTAAVAARDANTNSVDNHNLGTGTEGVVELTQWIEKMETVFRISNCSVENQIKTEIKKLEVELWELKVKGTNVIGYNQRFQELALLCDRMFPEESDKIEKYNKRQNTGRAYTAGSGKKKPYGGSKPLCSKCNYHHDGPCALKCHKCNKVGHFVRDRRSTTNANNANHQRGTRSGQKPTCFECGVQGHFKRECPKLKNNNNRGNQVGGGNAPAKVYAVGHTGTNLDFNVVT
ncbi:reverse transcriptase domain-containing protein, partial [Tanacetum coccineum]